MFETVTAFACGAATIEIARIAAVRIRKRLQTWRPRARTAVLPPADPRNEAQAILEMCGWNFLKAYDWAGTMMGLDQEHCDFWMRVCQCIEIFEAGRERSAA